MNITPPPSTLQKAWIRFRCNSIAAGTLVVIGIILTIISVLLYSLPKGVPSPFIWIGIGLGILLILLGLLAIFSKPKSYTTIESLQEFTTYRFNSAKIRKRIEMGLPLSITLEGLTVNFQYKETPTLETHLQGPLVLGDPSYTPGPLARFFQAILRFLNRIFKWETPSDAYIYTYKGVDTHPKRHFTSRLTIRGYMMAACFEENGDYWYLENLNKYHPLACPDLYVLYKAKDSKNVGVFEHSGGHMPFTNQPYSANKTAPQNGALKSTILAVSGTTTTTIPISVGIDPDLLQHHGGDSKAALAEVTSMINSLNLTMEDQFNAQFLLREFTSLPQGNATITSKLNTLTQQYRGTITLVKSDKGTIWLSYMAVGTHLTRRVGRAADRFAAGAFTYDGAGVLATLHFQEMVMAHEIGHNLGADHHFADANPPSVMHEEYHPTSVPTYSGGNQTQICKRINGLSAFYP